MREFVQWLVQSLVNHPEAVEVIEREYERRMVLVVKVAKRDIAPLIGQNGRVIRAIRALVKAQLPPSQKVSIELEGVEDGVR